MNEVLSQGSSIYDAGITEIADVITHVTERMLETRPRKPIRLRPYKDQFIRQQAPFGPYMADFTECWSDAPTGSIAYAAARFHAELEQEVVLTVDGTNKLWFNGRRYADAQKLTVVMKQGWNDLLLQCVREHDRWGFELLIAFPRYPEMWAKDYLFSTRPTFPQQALQGEEGFAYIGPFSDGLVLDEDDNKIERLEAEALAGDFSTWSPLAAAQTECRFVDFSELYGSDAACAYGATCYERQADASELVLDIEFEGGVKIWINDIEVCKSATRGRAQLEIPLTSAHSSGWVLVKCVRSASERWGFKAEITERSTGERADGLPMLETGRGDEARWIYLGSFGSLDDRPEKLMEQYFPVEADIRFVKPYFAGVAKEQIYWRLSSPDICIRPYLDGFFFGQWFYAIQVGLYGMLHSAEAVGAGQAVQYVVDSMEVMAHYHDYARWDAARYGVPTLIPRAMRLEELDPCGAIGVMFIEIYQRTGCEEMLPVIHRLADAVMNNVPRMEDGTFYRIDTMWADDFFMSCPFLVKMGKMTGETGYFAEVIRQAAGFHKRLWLHDKQLFAHIYFPGDDVNSRVPWGRGNGWIIFALTELLLDLPDYYSDREMLLGMYRELAIGIAGYQDSSGLWHQVLDESSSYLETSCTAMFVLSLARGLRMGWISDEFLETIQKGWNALLKYCVDAKGNVYGVCLGSGCARESAYYYDIPTHINDDHGTGVVLLAAKEMLALSRSR